MQISPEIMVLFGGTLLVLQLHPKRSLAKKRRRGMVVLIALLIELVTMVVGLIFFIIGAKQLLP